MNRTEIGRMIRYERTKANISLQKMAAGVCSTAALQRLESGERLPDFFVLERLIERLGKSVNKTEFLYDEPAHEICYLRERIELFLEQKNEEEAARALDYYESTPQAGEPLHLRYICQMRAVIESELRNNHRAAEKLLEEALAQTVPGFDLHRLEACVLGEGELILALMLLEAADDRGAAFIRTEGRRMLAYIEQVCRDEEVRANLYNKAAWLFGTVLMEQDGGEALWYDLQGERVLAANCMLLHLPQFLDRIVRLTGKKDRKAQAEWQRQRDALRSLYEEYGEPWEEDKITLWKNYRQREIYLVSELFGQERRLTGESQEKIADALEIDQKTVSRIECGKYKPKPGTFRKIKEYLQIDRDICTTRLVVDDFALLDLERDIAKLSSLRQAAEAEPIYHSLKVQLSLNWKENQQYVCFMDTLFDKELGRITPEEAIERCWQAFRITRQNVGPEQLPGIVLGRTENLIINYIARCYDGVGEKKKAIELLEKMLEGYENSRVDLKYHYVEVALLYHHLAIDYEETDQLEEAIVWCDRSILFELRCKKANTLGFMLQEKRYTMDRITGDKSQSKACYQQSYQLLKLMKKDKLMKSMREGYKKWYGEEVDI